MWWRKREIKPQLPPFPAGALLVGGAVRDLQLGRSPKDFDWLVTNPRDAALAYQQQHGGALFALDPVRNYWRLQASEVQHDFVPLPADLHTDLLRRDFTVNAMALDAAGQLHDPTGGKADLQARRIRMVSAENLWEDPLRAWRAVRLAVQLGAQIEPQTKQAISQLARELSASSHTRHNTAPLLPAAERQRDELQLLLGQPQAAHGLRLLDELGLLAVSVPELCEGKGVQQGGFHHLDVFEHQLEALHQLLARQPEASLPLRWATLLHDLGKPRSHSETEVLVAGEVVRRKQFYGHDRLGAQLAKARLNALKLPRQEAEQISQLIAAHMRPLPQNEHEARRFVHRLRPLLPDLLWLMLADREAARGPHSSDASRIHYAQGFERVLAALEAQPSAPIPLLSGQQVMHLLHIPSGPYVGELLRHLAQAQALGQVHTAEQAEQLLWQYHQHR